MFRSFINSSNITNSLIFQLKNYKSKAKSHTKKVKFYEANPQLFRKYSKMKPPDLTKKNLVFPLTIPIKYKYRFKPLKRTEIPANDILNFKFMTGNEILLYLERCSELRPTELCAALIELPKRPNSQKIDWSSHEFLVACKDFMIPKLSQYSHRVIHSLVLAFNKLKIFDPILWSGLHKESSKLLHLAKASMFAKLYRVYHEEGSKAPAEMLERMTTMLPNYIRLMSQNEIVNMFEIIIKNNRLNYHLFEDIFYVLFRIRNKWFGPENYTRIIKLFIEIKHLDDDEFWNKLFLPPLLEIKESFDEDNIMPLMEVLVELKNQSGDKVKIDDYLAMLQERLIFCKTKVKAIENNQMFNMILNDLQYYKEKELERMQRK